MKIKNLTFKFNKNSNYFFDNLNLDFEPNKLNFLTGQNGIGKSTLFNILQANTNQENVLSGEIEFENQTYNLDQKLTKNLLNKNVKLIEQKFDQMLIGNFNFEQNLAMANLKKFPGLSFFKKNYFIPNILNKLCIPKENKIKNLSGGQKQILSIIMAIQKKPKLLLADEPTAALDSQNSTLVLDFLKELSQEEKITTLIIIHDKKLLEKYSDFYFYIEHDKANLRKVSKIKTKELCFNNT